MTYLSPDVYLEEVPSASRPIEGVGTAIAAFVGFADEALLKTPALRVAAGVSLVVLTVLVVRRFRTS